MEPGTKPIRNYNAAIYMDYENILKVLKDYGVHPIRDLDFFEVICKKIKENVLSTSISIFGFTTICDTVRHTDLL